MIQGPQTNISYLYKGGKFYTTDDKGEFTKLVKPRNAVAQNGFSAYVNLPETKTRDITNYINFDPNKIINKGDKDGDGIQIPYAIGK